MKRTSECSDGEALDLEFGFSILEFLDSIIFMVLEVKDFEYCTVGSFAHFIYDLVLGSDVTNSQGGMFGRIHQFRQVLIDLMI